MKLKFNAKHNTIAAYCIIVFTVCLALVAIVFKYETFIGYLKKLLSVFSPVIWGIVIAYIVNPMMMFWERHLKKQLCKKKDRDGLVRVLSIAISFVIFLGIVALLIGSIVPEILSSVENIFKNMSSYLTNLRDYITHKISNLLEKDPRIYKFVNDEFDNIQHMTLNLISRYEPEFNGLLEKDGIIASITDSAWSLIIGLKNFFFGLVISIYLLFSKENFKGQATKIIYSLFSAKHGKRIFSVCSRFNGTFVNFLSGKALDSLIIGMITFLAMNIMKMPSYAVLVGCIIGITNMIPFFGPIIGAVPSGLLILLTNPAKTIVFVIFIILLQQFDGNILGPKIIGSSLGISTFWIIFSIIIGGGLFGTIGMFAFVPIFAVIFNLCKESVNLRLEKKKLPVSTSFYKDIDYMNPPMTGEEFKSAEEERPLKEGSKNDEEKISGEADSEDEQTVSEEAENDK